MVTDSGSWLWLVIDVVFVVLLAGSLIYGTMMYQSRRRTRATEQATRQLYRREAETERRAEGEPAPRSGASPVSTRIP